ncbi:MAG: pilus assembly protein PilM [Kiritimatiellales bacterium]
MSAKPKTATTKEQGRRLTHLLALDFATSGIKAVRLKKNKDLIALAAADILPPCSPDAEERPELPKPLATYYAALCATMDDAVLRVFTQTIPEEEDNIEAIVRTSLNAAADSRVGGLVLSRAKGKRESTLLGISVPEKTIRRYLELFANGAPAPHSLELSGLAALSAFLYNCGAQTENQTVCVIETGTRHTYASFLYRNQLQIINRFDVGGDSLVRQVETALGVDADMASTILTGGSVDVSSQVRQVLSPFTRQLSIYREFVERQNKSTLSAVYISGGLATSSYWQTAIKEVLGFIPQVWNPFEKIEIQPGAFPEHLKGQESRFAAAVGAALAGMEAL